MKKIILTFFLTFLVNVVCLPLWTEYEYGDFVRTLFNKEARLDLVYHGELTGAEPFSFQSTPQPSLCTRFYGSANNVCGVNLSLRAREKWQKISLRLQARRDGEINMIFRSPSVLDEYGYQHSVLTDWKDLKINGAVIFKGMKSLSVDNVFAKTLPVRKGDILQIEVEFRRYHFSTHDFKFLQSGNLWFLIMGNILTFFMIYRLLSYLAIRGGGNISDTVFLVVFFPCLFIPMIGISDAMKSGREGRMLAVKPALKEILKGNVGARSYEEWLSDHFGGRVSLLKLHDGIRNKVSSVIRAKHAFYFKDSGWLFGRSLLGQHWDFSSTFSKSIVQNLVQLNQFCQQNKIKFYVLEVPSKEHIYKDRNKLGFDKQRFTKVSQAQETIRDEARKYHIPYVYPYIALFNAAKQDFVFFKWSHHWTDGGAFIGYCELMKEVRKDFPDMPIVSLDDYQESHNQLIRDEWNREYWRGFTERILNFSDDPSNRSTYKYYDHRNGEKMAVKVGKFIKDFSYPGGKHKVMLIGRSQNENLLQFLPYSTAYLKFIRLNRGQVKTADEFKIMKLYKKDILAFKPDILILSIHTDELPRLRDICASK